MRQFLSLFYTVVEQTDVKSKKQIHFFVLNNSNVLISANFIHVKQMDKHLGSVCELDVGHNYQFWESLFYFKWATFR